MSEARQSMDPLERIEWVFSQRRGCRLALACLMLFYGLAIFAPLLAGDRPYVLRAVDYRGYAAALRTLSPVAASVERLLEQGPEDYQGQRLSWSEALESELGAAEQRVALLVASAPDSAQDAFKEYLVQLEQAVRLGSRGQDRPAALAAAQEARGRAVLLRESQRALDPAQPEQGGLRLAEVTSYPLLGTISGLEVLFMLLWCALVSRRLWSPLCNRIAWGQQWRSLADPDRRARLGRMRRLKLLGVLALCSSLAALWGGTLGGTAVFERAPYKAALDSGELVAERALFPPLAFGFAESHRGELHRPPSWSSREPAAQPAAAVQSSKSPALTPQPDVEVRYAEPARDSLWRHPLGTDSHGRDLLVRLLWGARVSLSVGLISALLVVLIGTLIGAVAGYLGGRVDFWISRLIEVVQCFPAFFLILLVLAFWDLRGVPPIFAIVVVMALVRWTGVARLARGEFLRLRTTQFALAARAAGVSTPGIILRHLLPNAMGPVLVAGTFLVASGVLTESALSFLGFGVQEPIPSWGSLINDSRSPEHWWIQLFPGLCIFLTVVSYNWVGEALRDALDPKLKP